jgi:hypothetical protein
MIELTGTVRNKTQMHIGTGKKTGTFSKNLEYIPGRTLRGMVGYYLYHNNRELFDATKINEDIDMANTCVFFKDALPKYNKKVTVASPVSLKWCKRCGTLMGPGADECSSIEKGKACLHEGKKVSGFITSESLDSGKLEKGDVKTIIETKCPIIRNGHTSPCSDYTLSPYHIESIKPGTEFAFRCIIEDEYIDGMKEALKGSGVFSGLGGYRSRGYGTVSFDELKETSVSEVIEKREHEIADISDKLLVANSQMILASDDEYVIGFDQVFREYASKTGTVSGYDIKIEYSDEETLHQKLTQGIARGWSIKHGNKVSDLIPCIGHGSVAAINSNTPRGLAALEVFGVGEMTNSGYGDVYIMGGVV